MPPPFFFTELRCKKGGAYNRASTVRAHCRWKVHLSLKVVFRRVLARVYCLSHSRLPQPSVEVTKKFVIVTVSEKTDHLSQVSDIDIFITRCSALFTLRNGEVRIAIVYTILK